MKVLVPFLLTFLLGACSSKETFNHYFCNNEGAYKLGYDDAKDDQTSSVAQLDSCDKDLKKDITAAYSKGYAEGKKVRAAELADEKVAKVKAEKEVKKAPAKKNTKKKKKS